MTKHATRHLVNCGAPNIWVRLTSVAAIATALVACASITPVSEKPSQSTAEAALPMPVEPTAEEWLNQGQALLETGQLDDAASCLDAAISKNPDLLEARFQLGQIAEMRQWHEVAIAHYEALLERAPDHREALRALGRIFLTQTKEFMRGAAVFSKALEKTPFDPEWLNAQALFLWSAGNTEAAKSALRKLLSRKPEDLVAHETLTLIAVSQGEWRLADLYSKRTIELAPENAMAHHGRALVLMSTPDPDLRDLTEAVRYLHRTLEIDPEFIEAWINLGQLALEYRDSANARESFGRAHALEPSRADVLLGLARAFEGLRDGEGKPMLSEAVEYYGQLLERHPTNVDALLGLARLFEGPRKDLDQALSLYERAAELVEPGLGQDETRQAAERVKQRISLEAELRAHSADSKEKDR